MIKLLLINLFLLISISGFSQMDRIEYIVNKPIIFTDKIDTVAILEKLFLEIDFSNDRFNDIDKLKELKNNVITKIELVYTTYASQQDFNQKDLNKARLKSLKKEAPFVFDNDLIEWSLIEQTGCKSKEEGKNYFHGFIVTFRPTSSEKTIETELDDFKEKLGMDTSSVIGINQNGYQFYVDLDTLSHEQEFFLPILNYSSTNEFQTFSYHGSYFRKQRQELDKTFYKYMDFYYDKREDINDEIEISFMITKKSEIKDIEVTKNLSYELDNKVIDFVKSYTEWKPFYKKGKPQNTLTTFTVYFTSTRYKFDKENWRLLSNYYKGKYAFSSSMRGYTGTYSLSDSVVFKVLERNQKWNKMLIVCDFTGSMSPYTSQLLLWHSMNYHLNKEKIKYFTFFNDGNIKNTSEKHIGKTGGIYSSYAASFDTIVDLAIKTIKNGHGGDIPENNIEAIISGINDCPDCQDVILIADNFATPRDLILLEQIKKPIKVILCGTYGGINIDYLNMVRRNGGSLHTIEDDIENLMELNEGEIVELGGIKYQIKDNKFKRLTGI